MYGLMSLPSLLSLFISTARPSYGLPEVKDLSKLTKATLPVVDDAGVEAANTNPILWPPCPFAVALRRKGTQSIIITRNDRKDYGLSAHDLARKVCTLMTVWIQKLPQGTLIHDPHWEHDSYGETHAAEFTIWMKLVPSDMSASALKLEREMAYFAMHEYCRLVAVFGAMQGKFEYWAWGQKMAVTMVYVRQWPKGEKAEVATA
ncbi:MAG: hypothetical protein LQ343_007906 [Gyalolechia ehrenbergii]|nr:MAG: hypothetical protein LQ343_007906 [Gyalolechia ehrenbergii]